MFHLNILTLLPHSSLVSPQVPRDGLDGIWFPDGSTKRAADIWVRVAESSYRIHDKVRRGVFTETVTMLY